MPLESALDAVKVWASGFGDLEPTSERVLEQRRVRDEEAAMIERNNRALAALRDRMPGLGV